jgi:hypothetical protein
MIQPIRIQRHLSLDKGPVKEKEQTKQQDGPDRLPHDSSTSNKKGQLQPKL